MSHRTDPRCNKIDYLLQQSEDLETLHDLEEKILMGLRLTVKEVFMSDYLRNAYPVEDEEILREMRVGTLTREQIITHALKYARDMLDQYPGDCNCEGCRGARNMQSDQTLE